MVSAIDKEERMWAAACHLDTLLGFIIPFANLLTPLIIWLLKREEMPFVDENGKESLNFQITWTLFYMVSMVLFFFCIGIPLIILLVLTQIILTIMAGVKAADGAYFYYPATLRLIK